MGGRRKKGSPSGGDLNVPSHVSDTVESLAKIHKRNEANVSKHQRGVEGLTRALGSARGIYAMVSLVVLWLAVNCGLLAAGYRPFDPPPFSFLQGLVSLAALLATAMVLATQNRQTHHADERSRLDLEVNLLSEAKLAKVIALMEELRRDLPNVRNRVDPVAEAMQEKVDPHEVLSALAQSLEQSHETTPPPSSLPPPSSPPPSSRSAEPEKH